MTTSRSIEQRLPVPTPEEVKDGRMRANLSQGQACEIVGFREVMSWSNCERRAPDGTPKATMDPLRWFVFRIATGQHPAFVLAPRLGAPIPEATTALRRRSSASADVAVTYVIEQRRRGHRWAALEGAPFLSVTAARAAVEALQGAQGMGPLRVTRYADDAPEQVLPAADKQVANSRRVNFSLRTLPRVPRAEHPLTPSCARYCWRR